MPENDNSSPTFAGRYKFQAVGIDWDKGRSGYTHLVFDIKKARLGVIKRAEIKDQKAVDELKNEVGALVDLKGHGVPEVYDTGEAEYGSKSYYYVIVEYIEAMRVEKKLDTLTSFERKEIIRQLFKLLAKAHGMGIVNGDVDLKHLFWRRDKKQLIVIDWGNSKLDIDRRQETEFAYDLARSAEIVYSLVTNKSHPPASGSLKLPENQKDLFPNLGKIPDKFRELCEWAPRAPAKGAISPVSSEKLFEAASNWKNPRTRIIRNFIFTIGIVAVLLAFLGIYLAIFGGLDTIKGWLYTPTNAFTAIPSPSPETLVSTNTPEFEIPPAITPSQVAEITPIIIDTIAPAITPTPKTYTNTNTLLLFDKDSKPDSECWKNDPSDSIDGFSQRDDGNWRFMVNQGIPNDIPVQTSFSECVNVNQINAMALNIWISIMDVETNSKPAREFGFFIINKNDKRRDYTIWIDKSGSLHLRVREDNNQALDEIITIIDDRNLKVIDFYPRKTADFSIQIFFEFDNQGLDILYLKQGQPQGVVYNELNPINMKIPSNNSVLPTIGNLKEVGLIGYGGEIRTAIWPLVFFEE